MVRPDMATMLGFHFTNANIDRALLQQAGLKNAQDTYNRITVDSDTSTSDTLLLAATGAARHPEIATAGARVATTRTAGRRSLTAMRDSLLTRLQLAAFAILLLLLMVAGLDQVTAFSAIAASLNNLGPGLGGVAENYAALTDFEKWVCILAMLLGRLEIFTLLILFTKTYWQK